MGFKPTITSRLSEIRKANEREAKTLQVSVDSDVLNIKRSISADGVVVAYFNGTFKIDEIPKSVVKKISTGPIFKTLDSIQKRPVKARTEIHAVKSNKIGWGSDRPKSDLLLQLSQVFFLRDGSPIFIGDDYFVEGRFQLLLFRTI